MDFFGEGLEILTMKQCWPYYIKIPFANAKDNPRNADNNDIRKPAGAEFLIAALWRERRGGEERRGEERRGDRQKAKPS